MVVVVRMIENRRKQIASQQLTSDRRASEQVEVKTFGKEKEIGEREGDGAVLKESRGETKGGDSIRENSAIRQAIPDSHQ